MASGLTLSGIDTPLTDRAAEFLASGPADVQTLISYVCQLPGAPLHVAEHMAAALFAGHQKFAREADGRWKLRVRGEAEGVRSAEGVGGAENDALDNQSFVVVDVETTGARAYGGDRVTEVAAVQVRSGVATTVFDTLINPERPIPPQVTAVTNITAQMVRNAPRFADVCDQLLGVLEGQVFVAHNALFDWRFLTMEIERATRRAIVGRSLCTVRMARRLLPQLKRRNLDAISNFYGIENRARHRAGGDAEATAQVFLRLLDVARDRGCVTVGDLQGELSRGTSAGKKRKRRASALPHSAFDGESA